jgi:hypothetical protein
LFQSTIALALPEARARAYIPTTPAISVSQALGKYLGWDIYNHGTLES